MCANDGTRSKCMVAGGNCGKRVWELLCRPGHLPLNMLLTIEYLVTYEFVTCTLYISSPACTIYIPGS